MAHKDPLEISNERFTELVVVIQSIAHRLPQGPEETVLLVRAAKILANVSHDNGYFPQTFDEYMKEHK